MSSSADTKDAPGLRPVDYRELLEKLQLGIGQAAQLCGVSIRQLSYWTDKGIIQPMDDSRSRTYSYAALEKVCMIKQAIDQGYSLEGAVAEVDALLHQRTLEDQRFQQMSDQELEGLVMSNADRLQQLAERIRRGIRTYRVSGDLGRLAASLGGVEKLIGFFEANPYTVNTARQIALRLGREAGEVEKELDLLEHKRFIQKISYPSSDVYRYIPQRRR